MILQPPEGLFTQEGEIVPPCWADDLFHLRAFIRRFYAKAQLDCDVEYHKLLPVQQNADDLLRANVRIASPSVFKRAAAFTLGFLQASPLPKSFGPELFGNKVGHIPNHENAIIAFEYCRTCLHEATYPCSEGTAILKNRITVGS